MRKIIPFIASRFQKDKIWLRRTAPNKRKYQILLAIDDSKSMSCAPAADAAADAAGNDTQPVTPGVMACEALTTLCCAMSRLEVGEIAIASFGSTVNLLHPFTTPFTPSAGAEVLSRFTFQQPTTDFAQTLQSVVQVLTAAATASGGAARGNGSQVTQLVFLITDGKIDQGNRELVGQWVRRARLMKQLLVVLIVDPTVLDTNVVYFEDVSSGYGE